MGNKLFVSLLLFFCANQVHAITMDDLDGGRFYNDYPCKQVAFGECLSERDRICQEKMLRCSKPCGERTSPRFGSWTAEDEGCYEKCTEEYLECAEGWYHAYNNLDKCRNEVKAKYGTGAGSVETECNKVKMMDECMKKNSYTNCSLACDTKCKSSNFRITSSNVNISNIFGGQQSNCMGEIPPNSVSCPDDEQNVLVPEERRLVSICSSPEGSEPKCEYVCIEGVPNEYGECIRVGFIKRTFNWIAGLFN